jgi:hypothetical protein
LKRRKNLITKNIQKKVNHQKDLKANKNSLKGEKKIFLKKRLKKINLQFAK